MPLNSGVEKTSQYIDMSVFNSKQQQRKQKEQHKKSQANGNPNEEVIIYMWSIVLFIIVVFTVFWSGKLQSTI